MSTLKALNNMDNKTALDTQHDRMEQQPNISPDAEGGEALDQDDHHLSPKDWDFYGLSLEVEFLSNYELGGYHPVHLRDTFQEKYAVIHKLGFGGSATVWLARDKDQNRYVALKILCAEISSDSRDVETLKSLEQRHDSGPGCQHITFLLDHFQIEGPNGSHLCLVSELLGPALSQLAFSRKQLRGSVARKIARQAVEAVAWLHSHGVCHGDLTAANYALELASIDSWSEQELYNHIGEPRTEIPKRASGKQIPPSVPRYLVEPASFWQLEPQMLTGNIRLIDFGISYFADKAPSHLGTPPGFAAPEIFFEQAVGQSTDLWALGCTIYTIRSNAALFEIRWGGLPEECIGAVVEVLGPPPPKWNDLYFDEDGKPKPRGGASEGEEVPSWANYVPDRISLSEIAANIAEEYHGPPREEDDRLSEKLPTELKIEAEGCTFVRPKEKPTIAISKEEAEKLEDLLQKVIRWDPKERPSAQELLAHEWFLGDFEDRKTAEGAPDLFQS